MTATKHVPADHRAPVTINGHRIVRTYRIRDWTPASPHVVHVTDDGANWRQVWLDTLGRGHGGKVCRLSALPPEAALTKDTVLCAVNM